MINTTHDEYYSTVIYHDISDHFPTFLNINLSPIRSFSAKKETREKRIYNTKNFSQFLESIKHEFWFPPTGNNYSFENLTPHEANDVFIEKFSQHFVKAFKKVLMNGNGGKNNSQPWMTDSLITSCRKKSRLLKIYKRTGTNISRIKYVRYKNVLKQAIKDAEKKSYEEEFLKKSGD